MRFSVVIPCHNNAATVAEALESVRAQEYPAAEVIVVDDGSTDDGAAIAAATGVPDRILAVNEGNAAACRNAGIVEASSEWIAFLDADNLWMRDHLTIARELLQAGGDGVFCSSPLSSGQEVSDGVARLRSGHPLADATTGLTRQTFVDWRLASGWGFPTTGIVIARTAVERIGGFDPALIKAHDFELVMRAICYTTWCATPLATWWSRQPQKGHLSSDPVDSALYALKAFQRNESRYPGKNYKRLLARAAYRAVAISLDHGGMERADAALELGRPHMSLLQRLKLLLRRLRH